MNDDDSEPRPPASWPARTSASKPAAAAAQAASRERTSATAIDAVAARGPAGACPVGLAAPLLDGEHGTQLPGQPVDPARPHGPRRQPEPEPKLLSPEVFRRSLRRPPDRLGIDPEPEVQDPQRPGPRTGHHNSGTPPLHPAPELRFEVTTTS